MSAQSRFCSQCGEPVPSPDAAFCGACGSRIAPISSPQSHRLPQPPAVPTEAPADHNLSDTRDQLATVPRRLAALIIDTLYWAAIPLLVRVILDGAAGLLLALFVGAVGWYLLQCRRGQTPGKRMVGVYAAPRGRPERPLTFWPMLLREFVIKGILFGAILSSLTLGTLYVLDYLWALWDGKRQTLHDKLSGTQVFRS